MAVREDVGTVEDSRGVGRPMTLTDFDVAFDGPARGAVGTVEAIYGHFDLRGFAACCGRYLSG